MFPNTTVPEPIDFMYPRWSTEPWTYGSFSNWPPGTSLATHQNLRANISRLFFAGEATSSTYFGFLHGAYFEGLKAGMTVAGLATGRCFNQNAYQTGNITGLVIHSCVGEQKFETLHGTTPLSMYSSLNGWDTSSFLQFDQD